MRCFATEMNLFIYIYIFETSTREIKGMALISKSKQKFCVHYLYWIVSINPSLMQMKNSLGSSQYNVL